jgi:hypothetical protein
MPRKTEQEARGHCWLQQLTWVFTEVIYRSSGIAKGCFGVSKEIELKGMGETKLIIKGRKPPAV